MSERDLLNAPKTYALLRALSFAHVDVSPGSPVHAALTEFAHVEVTKAEELVKEHQQANPITIHVKTSEEARRLIESVRSEEREEIARLKRQMARAAALAEKLQPDTLAGVVVSLLTAGGPEVENGADVIRALADALQDCRAFAAALAELTGNPDTARAARAAVESGGAALRLAGRL